MDADAGTTETEGSGHSTDAVECEDASTAKSDFIDASLSLGTGENDGLATEELTQTGAKVPNVEEKLEAHSEWWHTAMLLLADIVGSGVLGLPGAFSRVGWVFGILLLVVCYPMNLYTGVILARLYKIYPKATTFASLGREVFGRAGELTGYIVLYSYIFLLLGDYLIVMARCIQEMFYSTTLCRPWAGLIACFLVFFSNQIRDLHKISFLSIISVITIVIVLILCMVDIFTKKVPDDAQWTAFPSAVRIGPGETRPATVFDIFSSASKFVFAMGGQKIYLEMMAAMRDPTHFPRSLYSATPAMLLVYAFVSIASYYKLGNTTPPYMLDVLNFGVQRVIASILMFVHILISYTLNQQVLCRALHLRWDPKLANTIKRSEPGYWKGQGQWAIITTAVMFFCWFLSNLIPFFDNFISLMGALESAPLSFLFPCGLILRAAAMQKLSLSTGEKVVQYAICVVSIVLMIMGTIAAIRGIVENAASFGNPFDCFCDATPATCCASGFHPVDGECCVQGPTVSVLNGTNNATFPNIRRRLDSQYVKTDGVGVPCP